MTNETEIRRYSREFKKIVKDFIRDVHDISDIKATAHEWGMVFTVRHDDPLVPTPDQYESIRDDIRLECQTMMKFSLRETNVFDTHKLVFNEVCLGSSFINRYRVMFYLPFYHKQVPGSIRNSIADYYRPSDKTKPLKEESNFSVVVDGKKVALPICEEGKETDAVVSAFLHDLEITNKRDGVIDSWANADPDSPLVNQMIDNRNSLAHKWNALAKETVIELRTK